MDLLQKTKANLPHLNQVYSSPYDFIFPYNEMGRCVCDKDSMAIKYFLDKLDSSKKITGEPSVLTGEDGDVMVYIPCFAYKVGRTDKMAWSVSTIKPNKWANNLPKGHKVHPWFINHDGTIAEYRLVGAFEGHVLTNQLRSIAGVIPTRSKTIGSFRTDARQGRSTKFNITTFYEYSALQLLMINEFGTLDMQTAMGKGKSELNTTTDLEPTGYALLTTGETIKLGNRSGYLVAADGRTNGKASISYRGIENIYASIWKFVDGILITDDGYNHTMDPANFGTVGSHTLAPAIPIMGDADGTEKSGYIKNIENIESLEFAFLPSELGGSSSTYFTDNFWSHRRGQTNIALVGGAWNDGANYGAFCWDWIPVSSSAHSTLGARLCYLA